MEQKRLIFLLAFVLVGLVSAASSYLEQCPKFRIKKSTIIKTQQSIHDGAEFLGKKVMSSSRGCHDECCKKEGCNMVMLKYDVESSTERVACFMFNCRSPSVCTFYQHSSYHSYAALEYEDRKPAYSSHMKDYHRDEHKAEITTTTEAPYTTTELPYTTTEPPKVYKPGKAKHWEHINWFDATTTTTPKYIKPEYNSGYDSNNAQTSGKDWSDHRVTTTSTTHYIHHLFNSMRHNKASKENLEKTQDSTKYGSYDHTQIHPDSSKRPTDAAAMHTTEEEKFPRRAFVDNNPDFPEEPKAHTKGTKTKAKPKTHPRTASREKPTKPRVSNVIIRRMNIQENKAVIPLAVGLVLALLLLMAIIFRLKTSRRRRTKAFLTDDADYLINGMYL